MRTSNIAMILTLMFLFSSVAFAQSKVEQLHCTLEKIVPKIENGVRSKVVEILDEADVNLNNSCRVDENGKPYEHVLISADICTKVDFKLASCYIKSDVCKNAYENDGITASIELHVNDPLKKDLILRDLASGIGLKNEFSITSYEVIYPGNYYMDVRLSCRPKI